MIINDALAVQMYETIKGTKQISTLSFSEDRFKQWCHTINVISGIHYKVKMLGDFELEMYKIQEQFSDLVVPRRITLAEGDQYEDYRGSSYDDYKPENYGFDKDIKVLEADDFNSVCMGISGSRKKSVELKAIVEFSKSVLFDTIKDRAVRINDDIDNTMLLPTTSYYVPVDCQIVQHKQEFFTMKASVFFKMWFQKALDELGNK